MPEFQVHPDVVTWLKTVFRDCNERITEKLNNNPNAPEESLDLTWIEHLSRYSSPVTLSQSWSVKVQAHYLGGLRHFYRWEIADIGVLLFLRSGGQIKTSKVALLQSKRLYPTNRGVEEELKLDYELGFARLADPEELARPLMAQAEFTFDQQSQYGAIIPGSEQVNEAASLLPAVQSMECSIGPADSSRTLRQTAGTDWYGRSHRTRAGNPCFATIQEQRL